MFDVALPFGQFVPGSLLAEQLQFLGDHIMPYAVGPSGTDKSPSKQVDERVNRFAGGCSVLRFLFFEQVVVNCHKDKNCAQKRTKPEAQSFRANE